MKTPSVILAAMFAIPCLYVFVGGALFFHIKSNFECATNSEVIEDARNCFWFVYETKGGEHEISEYTGDSSWVDSKRLRTPDLTVHRYSSFGSLGLVFHILVAPDGKILGRLDTFE